MGHKKKKLKMQLIKVAIAVPSNEDPVKKRKRAAWLLAEALMDGGFVIFGKSNEMLGYEEARASLYVAKPILEHES